MSNLENTLKQLRLSGLLQTLDVRLHKKRSPTAWAMPSFWN
jgi:hypothetical protein